MPAFGGAPKCVVCQKSAYQNEAMAYNKNTYHNACFKCATCGKTIQTVASVSEHNGQIYHKNCFVQEFRTSGGKYGGQAAAAGDVIAAKAGSASPPAKAEAVPAKQEPAPARLAEAEPAKPAPAKPAAAEPAKPAPAKPAAVEPAKPAPAKPAAAEPAKPAKAPEPAKPQPEAASLAATVAAVDKSGLTPAMIARLEAVAARLDRLAGGSGAPSAPSAPSAPAAPAAPASSSSAGSSTGMGAVFGEISKGSAITSGLKKVDKSLMTHKNPALRAQPGLEAKAVPKAAAPQAPKGEKPKGEAKIHNARGTWFVENFDNRHDLEVPDAEVKESVYVVRCDNCTVTISKKVKSIQVDSCKKTRIVFDSVVSTFECFNSQRVEIDCTNVAPSIALDKCSGIIVQMLSEQGKQNPPQLVTSNISECNFTVPGKRPEDDPVEIPLPEQYISVYKPATGKIETNPTNHGD